MFNGTRNEDWCVEVTRPIYVCKLKTERVWRAVFDARKGCKRAAARLVSGCGGERGRSREAHARRRATAGARAVRRRAGGGKDSMAGEMFPRQSVHQYRYRYLGCGVSEGAQCSDAWPLNGSPRHETIAALRLCPVLLCSSSPRRLCHMVASHPIWRLNGTRHSERTMDGGWLATNRRWAGTAECIRP